jgi:hypothetical protein
MLVVNTNRGIQTEHRVMLRQFVMTKITKWSKLNSKQLRQNSNKAIVNIHTENSLFFPGLLPTVHVYDDI